MTGFESFVGVNPWTALFTFCNMLITFAVLKKFLFKPVKKMIDDRQQEIDTMYADADAAKQKAADLEKEYADHLQSIKDERDAMLREATARNVQCYPQAFAAAAMMLGELATVPRALILDVGGFTAD